MTRMKIDSQPWLYKSDIRILLLLLASTAAYIFIFREEVMQQALFVIFYFTYPAFLGVV